MTIGERRTRDGVEWPDPRDWLKAALVADHRDPVECGVKGGRDACQRRGQLMADIAIFDEAIVIYERLVAQGQENCASPLSELYGFAALVHETADDLYGALGLYDQALRVTRRVLASGSNPELSDRMAMFCVNKATVLSALGNHSDAITLLDQAITRRESLVDNVGSSKLRADLALSVGNRGNALRELGRTQEALSELDRAIAIYERLISEEGLEELASNLALQYMNKGLVMRAMGDMDAAIRLHDKGIRICERLVGLKGRSELSNGLAIQYVNKANTLNASGEKRAAAALYDKAIAIRERLVHAEQRSELARSLAVVYANKAGAIANMGDVQKAVILIDKAIAIVERLVNVEGRSELTDELAGLHHNRGVLAGRSDDICTRMSNHDLIVLQVQRNHVYRCDITEVAQTLNGFLASRERVIAGRERVCLTIDGYNDDERDLWDIPEVRHYMSALDTAFPYLLYFASPYGKTLEVLALCLCRVQYVQGGATPHPEDLERFVRSHLLGLWHLCDRFDLDNAVKKEVAEKVLKRLMPRT